MRSQLFIPHVALMLCTALHAASQTAPAPKPAASISTTTASATAAQRPISFNQAVDQIISQERGLLKLLTYFHPVVETYLQNTRADSKLGEVPAGDEYFLGQLNIKDGHPEVSSYLANPGVAGQLASGATSLYAFGARYSSNGFARMVVPDTAGLDREHYTFTFVRREMLGEVRCLVLDILPAPNSGERFRGRIWVEDQDYHIVRFNGALDPAPRGQVAVHFDSWRLNLLANDWLPAYTYSEEPADSGRIHPRYKAQTRIFGYDLEHAGDLREYAQPLSEDVFPDPARAKADPSYNLNPGLSQHRFQYSGEDNVVERLQVAGLMAPAGDVDQVLLTVVRNIEITNQLDLQPDVRCRVMLTAPFETFSVGRTIVISRGLIDVLPDEATLAVVLAHELAHIALGHSAEGKYSVPQNVMFPNEQTLQKMDFRQDPAKEEAANHKAIELLLKSPYKDKLAQAGLFLKQLEVSAPQLPNLVQPHLGNGLRDINGTRMAYLEKLAPPLEAERTDQIAALPLGSRIHLDPWSNRIEFAKKTSVPVTWAGEKKPFEITPYFPYLKRLSTSQEAPSKQVAAN